MKLASPWVFVALSVGLAGCSGDGTGSRGDSGGSGNSGNGTAASGSGSSGSRGGGSGADGSGADGSGADGSGADGSAANGSGADGSGADGSGADGSGADGSGGSGADTGDPTKVFSKDCERQSIGADVSPPVIMLVVDTSQSMTGTRFASTNGLSKWEATRNALSEALRAMPSDYAVGLVFYPNTPQVNPPPCFVENLAEIAPLTQDHIAELEGAMRDHDVAGYTPTLEAWKYAYAQLQAWTPDDPRYQNSDRYLVVITDGVPTRGQDCEMPWGRLALSKSQYLPLMDAVAAGYANGYGTFVIGSVGSEDDTQGNLEYEDAVENYVAREMLSAVAVAGGTAPDGCSNNGTPAYCHFDMTTSTEFTPALVAALGTIAESVVGCSYTIPEPTAVNVFLNSDPDTFTVEYYPGNSGPVEAIARAPSDAACSEGWQLSADETQIDLCPATCDRVRADAGAAIQILFECVVPQ